MNTDLILLAEDDVLDAQLALNALKEVNLSDKVVVVKDGEEVLDYLYFRGKFEARVQENPIVIFLDLKMPKIDGLRVLKTVKGDSNLRKIPVVMLTSSRVTRDLTECYDGGANAYVVKPVDSFAFANVVKEIGKFWGTHNEPPPIRNTQETSILIKPPTMGV